MQPWTTLDTIATAEGKLELRRRGDDEFLIVIDGRVLMTSSDRRSEEGLATLACAPLAHQRGARVLIGGLGMAYTLRAALDALPADARVTVAELTPAVVTWCQGPLGRLTREAVLDPRVDVVIDDVARVIAGAPAGHYHAIVLDLYEGPNAQTQGKDDPFYGTRALHRTRAALAPGGLLAIWAEDPDQAFTRRFAAELADAATHRIGVRRRHVVYLGRRPSRSGG